MQKSLALHLTLIIAYLLTAGMTCANIFLIEAFTWSPGGNGNEWFFTLNKWACYILGLGVPVLFFWRPKWGALAGFVLLSACFYFWWLSFCLYLYQGLFEYGLVNITHIFYLVFYLFMLYGIVMSAVVVIRGFFLKKEPVRLDKRHILIAVTIISYLPAAGFVAWWVTDALEHSFDFRGKLANSWMYYLSDLICLFLMAIAPFLLVKKLRLGAWTSLVGLIVLTPWWFEPMEAILSNMFSSGFGLRGPGIFFISLPVVHVFAIVGTTILLVKSYRKKTAD